MFDFLSRMSSRQKGVFFLALFVGISALYVRLLIVPMIDKIDLIKADMDETKSTIQMDMDILARKSKIEKEVKFLEDYFQKSVPDDSVIKQHILSSIERLSSQNNVKLVKNKPSRIEKNESFYKYYVDLECSGELENIISFMHAVNSNEQLLQIDQFKLSPRRGEDNQMRAVFVITKLLVGENLPKQETLQ